MLTTLGMMIDMMVVTELDALEYLDSAIRAWRRSAADPLDKFHDIAPYYVDALQSVRVSLFGSVYPQEIVEPDSPKPRYV